MIFTRPVAPKDSDPEALAYSERIAVGADTIRELNATDDADTIRTVAERIASYTGTEHDADCVESDLRAALA